MDNFTSVIGLGWETFSTQSIYIFFVSKFKAKMRRLAAEKRETDEEREETDDEDKW